MRLRSLLHGAAVSVMVATPLIAQDVRDSTGPIEKQARQVSLENPVPRRLASKPVEYPAQMHLSGGRGLVNLQITLDADGKIAEIRGTGAQLIQPAGPINSAEERETTDALLKSAIAAAREWTFAPPAEGPLTFQAAFMFFNGTVDIVLAPPASARGRGAGATGASGAAVPPTPWRPQRAPIALAETCRRRGGRRTPRRTTRERLRISASRASSSWRSSSGLTARFATPASSDRCRASIRRRWPPCANGSTNRRNETASQCPS